MLHIQQKSQSRRHPKPCGSRGASDELSSGPRTSYKTASYAWALKRPKIENERKSLIRCRPGSENSFIPHKKAEPWIWRTPDGWLGWPEECNPFWLRCSTKTEQTCERRRLQTVWWLPMPDLNALPHQVKSDRSVGRYDHWGAGKETSDQCVPVVALVRSPAETAIDSFV